MNFDVELKDGRENLLDLSQTQVLLNQFKKK